MIIKGIKYMIAGWLYVTLLPVALFVQRVIAKTPVCDCGKDHMEFIKKHVSSFQRTYTYQCSSCKSIKVIDAWCL